MGDIPFPTRRTYLGPCHQRVDGGIWVAYGRARTRVRCHDRHQYAGEGGGLYLLSTLYLLVRSLCPVRLQLNYPSSHRGGVPPGLGRNASACYCYCYWYVYSAYLVNVRAAHKSAV